MSEDNKGVFPGMTLWLSGGNENMSDPKETTKPNSARESAKRMGITLQRDDTHLDIETGKRMTDDMDETTKPSAEAMAAAAKAIEITRDNYATLQVRVAWALDAFAAQAVAKERGRCQALAILGEELRKPHAWVAAKIASGATIRVGGSKP